MTKDKMGSDIDSSLEKISKASSIGKVVGERIRQITTLGYTIEKDIENNSDEQLLHAVFLLIASLNDDNANAVAHPPKGWQQDYWNKYLFKNKKEKLIMMATFLMAEYDRLIYIEEDKTFKQKSKWQKVK